MRIKKMNLQLFSELFPEGHESDVTNPILGGDGDNLENQNVDDVVSDDNVNDDSNDTGQQTQTTIEDNTSTDTNDDFNSIQDKIDMILNKIQEEEPVVQEEPEVVEPTQEELEKLNNDFYLDFTERPLEAINKLIEERANEKVKPMQEYIDNIQRVDYWNKQIDEFQAKHPDFKDMVNEISEVIQSDESIRNAKNPIELAYKFVKADKLEAELKEKTKPIDEQLKDSDILKQILGNKELKNLIVKELKLEKDVVPNVIGADGQTNVNVGDKPKSIEEATKAWLNQ